MVLHSLEPTCCYWVVILHPWYWAAPEKMSSKRELVWAEDLHFRTGAQVPPYVPGLDIQLPSNLRELRVRQCHLQSQSDGQMIRRRLLPYLGQHRLTGCLLRKHGPLEARPEGSASERHSGAQRVVLNHSQLHRVCWMSKTEVIRTSGDYRGSKQ